MRLVQDQTTRALFIGGRAPGSRIGFIVERLSDRSADFRIVWQDAEHGISYTHHATMLKSEPVATSPSMSPDNAHTSASSLSGDDSPGSPV